jgi:PAS domain S-box-containing protein
MIPNPAFSADSRFDLSIISDAHLQVALNLIQIGFWEIELMDMSMRSTSTCKENFGLTAADDFTYERMISMIHEEDRPHVIKSIAAAINEKGEAFMSEYRVNHQQGRPCWIRADGLVIHHNGRPQKLVGTIRDITEAKLSEMRKDELLSIVQHEVNTPLTSIRGYLQLLERITADHNDEKVSKVISRTAKSTERLMAIITEYFTNTQKVDDQLNLRHETFRLDELIYEIADNIQTIAFTHHINLYDVNETWVDANRQGISQVLSNLLTNAIKYSPNQTTVDIRLTVEANQVKVLIHDYGMGIPQAAIPKLFDKAFRVSHDTDIAGSGMGLYICKEIIQRHRGFMGVESTEGKGSTFYFTLPAVNV